ncbi:MAG: hypothetical protein KGK08_14895, partial [Acidobacteriota bacterium]|nr:hypothetical protein [Acidobacteriota bacterium]
LPGVGDKVRVTGTVQANGGIQVSSLTELDLASANPITLVETYEPNSISSQAAAVDGTPVYTINMLGIPVTVGVDTSLEDAGVNPVSGTAMVTPFNITSFQTYISALTTPPDVHVVAAVSPSGNLVAQHLRLTPGNVSPVYQVGGKITTVDTSGNFVIGAVPAVHFAGIPVTSVNGVTTSITIVPSTQDLTQPPAPPLLPVALASAPPIALPPQALASFRAQVLVGSVVVANGVDASFAASVAALATALKLKQPLSPLAGGALPTTGLLLQSVINEGSNIRMPHDVNALN